MNEYDLHWDVVLLRINMSFAAVLSSVDDIEAEAVKLNTSAKRCSQEILVGFEPKTV